MKELLNKWLWLDLLFYKDEFQEINKLELIHPLDRESFKSYSTNILYECIGFEDNYLLIKNKLKSFRVKKEAIKQIMPTPKFNWGDKVFQYSKPKIEAYIDDFFWHHKEQKYLYYIIVNNKKKPNRYDESDLVKV